MTIGTSEPAIPTRSAADGVTRSKSFDWSVRRNHLAGVLGAALLAKCYERGWAKRVSGTRVVQFSAAGERAFRECFAL